MRGSTNQRILPAQMKCKSLVLYVGSVQLHMFSKGKLKIMLPFFACRYAILLQCWEADPHERPHFANLVVTISTTLEMIAGYLDLGATTLNIRRPTTEAEIVTVAGDAEPQVEKGGSELQAKETVV